MKLELVSYDTGDGSVGISASPELNWTIEFNCNIELTKEIFFDNKLMKILKQHITEMHEEMFDNGSVKVFTKEELDIYKKEQEKDWQEEGKENE